MKIIIYTIAKNEEKHVNRFMDSCQGADGVYIADTGSTDNTVKLLRDRGAFVQEIQVNPWRFDTARNKNLEAVPPDVDLCISVDLDEVLAPDWRSQIEQVLVPGVNQVHYLYAWQLDEHDRPTKIFDYCKAHSRNGFEWRRVVHEYIYPLKTTKVVPANTKKLLVKHYPDSGKSRDSYLDLLALSVQEEPDNDRNSHYYGRELYFHKHWEKAIRELTRHLSMPSAIWAPERAKSMYFIALCYLEQGEKKTCEQWLLKNIAECPTVRETWLCLAEFYLEQGNWAGAYFTAHESLKIKTCSYSYLTEMLAWKELPHEILLICSYYMGLQNEAIEHCKKALEFDPDSQDLKEKLELLTRKKQVLTRPKKLVRINY